MLSIGRTVGQSTDSDNKPNQLTIARIHAQIFVSHWCLNVLLSALLTCFPIYRPLQRSIGSSVIGVSVCLSIRACVITFEWNDLWPRCWWRFLSFIFFISEIVKFVGQVHLLSLVHTSNNVEATFDFVERIVRLVAFDNVASTLLLVWTLP